jgi:hypothetical protein
MQREIVAAAKARLPLVFVCARGKEDEGCGSSRDVAAQSGERGVAVHLRHQQVVQHDIGSAVACRRDASDSIGSAGGLESLQPQHPRKVRQYRRFVLDDQDLRYGRQV